MVVGVVVCRIMCCSGFPMIYISWGTGLVGFMSTTYSGSLISRVQYIMILGSWISRFVFCGSAIHWVPVYNYTTCLGTQIGGVSEDLI